VNLSASAVVLRPRSLAEVLDLTCRVGTSIALGLYVRLGLLVLLPVFAGGLALRFAAGWSFWLVLLLAFAVGTILQGIFTIAIGRLLFADTLTARQVLRTFAGRLFSYLGALTLARGMLVASLGIGWPWLLFVHEASLLESASAVPSVQRSGRFARGRVGEVLGFALVLLLAQAAFVLVAELLGQGLVADLLQLGKPFGALFKDGGSPFALAGLLASFPFVATARFLRYVDLRTRSDGWDIQLRFTAIALADSEGRVAA